VKKFGSKAYEAILKEMSQIIDIKTIRSVELRSLTSRQRSKIIRSHMFFKEKFYPNGELEKLKARFVAGGDGQDRSMYCENHISSQTVSTSSVFIIPHSQLLRKELLLQMIFKVRISIVICHLMVKTFS
jgi:hypothetical protein